MGAVRAIFVRLVNLPTREGASLSMSHAAAILVGEAMRQRTGNIPAEAMLDERDSDADSTDE